MAPTKNQITFPKSDELTLEHLQTIQAWGELYIFDLPKTLRGDLFKINLITFHCGSSESLAPQTSVEASEEIWPGNPEWIKRIKLFGQAYRFEFFRCVLPQSYDRESGLIFDKPLFELQRLQHDPVIFGHRRWTLIIFGKENIAAIHLQTDLAKHDESETIKDRLVVLKDEVIKLKADFDSRNIFPTINLAAPGLESKNGDSKSYPKSKKEKVVEKLSRKKGAVDRDHMNKAGSELLSSWENELDKSELIFVGASKKEISTFFPESSSLHNKLRAFPFAFGSPDIEELKRCYVKLTTAKLDRDL
ncbi:uncharacterized protein MELLADRAFT_63647 [Melampsora larici-populina 98AG31]|uniref:VLRF1 domain-containing protein n=1 Tax=Melampsora larici-populina (strain 98AG31 / pathotype 3-4-7) TaxID=747676 RepID=F4RNG0_MELLP|nr:uncharacterized protein MELLADRAFT_63647 [Melampsora larici-populina 98AG31]EGG06102.1 hypothetical protein MELLADRAFT_63647 [Melampsora larici-populina 98AG31]